MRLGVIRAQRDRALEALQRLTVAIKLVQRRTAIVGGLGIVRLDRKSAVKTLERFFVTAEDHQHGAKPESG
ncbi:MAG: hypothetical protein NTV56_26655 [Alphaproteobacteria bacterium]|nr:hypothetical protein [Alphaproteobacteria bacterium]